MVSFRRWLLFQAFLLHQGGFLFYAAVVVPIGTDQLGSALLQGLITQRVTWWLNLFGFAWLIVAAWDTRAESDRRSRRWIVWGLRAALAVALVVLHDRMAAFLDLERERVSDRVAFRNRHIAYLWLSTLDWILGMIAARQAIRAWTAHGGSGTVGSTVRGEASPSG